MASSPSIRQCGFSLAELMVTIGVFSILAGIAIPSFTSWLPDYYLRAAARDLLSNFQLARLTAIRTGHNCAITFNQPIEGVTYGYVVFKDADNDLEFDTDEEALTRVNWRDYKGVSLYQNSLPTNDEGLPAVAFRSNGIPVNNANGFGAGTVSLQNTKSSTKGVVLSAAGNLRIE